MSPSTKLAALLGILLLLNVPLLAQKNNDPSTKSVKKMKQVLIDQLTVPANVKDSFIQRMNINRALIKQLPGFVKDEVYERQDENGNSIFVTVATWENEDLFKKAKQSVDLEYKRTGFNPIEFCQKLNIKIERSIYQLREN